MWGAREAGERERPAGGWGSGLRAAPAPGRLASTPSLPASRPSPVFPKDEGGSWRRLQPGALPGWVAKGCAGAGAPSPNSRAHSLTPHMGTGEGPAFLT